MDRSLPLFVDALHEHRTATGRDSAVRAAESARQVARPPLSCSAVDSLGVYGPVIDEESFCARKAGAEAYAAHRATGGR